MTTRVFENNNPVRFDISPMTIAQRRADRLPNPADRARFMDWFGKSRVATLRGVDLYVLMRNALVADDSVMVAGLIEGAASAHGMEGLVF